MYTSRRCLVGIALAAVSTLSTAQTQHPLTQQLQNNPPAPVQSQSYQLSPANTAATSAVSSGAVSAARTPSNVPAAPARVTPTATPVVQTVSTPAAAQPQASAAPAQAASTSTVAQPQASAASTPAASNNSTVVRNQGATTSNTSAPAAATQSRAYAPRAPIGDVTRTLLAIQASPNRSGTPHTVLGETATRSWDRYLRSFESDIPERFQQLEAQRSSR